MTQQDISQQIVTTATALGVDPRLALEVAQVESGLNQSAVSAAGAIGIFQLMPATAAGMGVDPTDPVQNIQGGVQYLAQLIAQFSTIQEALAAYNWGPGNVQNAIAAHGAVWLYYAPAETQDYVATILGAVGTDYSVSIGSSPTVPTAAQPGIPSVASTPAALSATELWILAGLALAGILVMGWITD